MKRSLVIGCLLQCVVLGSGLAAPVSARMRSHMRHAPGSPGVYVKTFQL